MGRNELCLYHELDGFFFLQDLYKECPISDKDAVQWIIQGQKPVIKIHYSC